MNNFSCYITEENHLLNVPEPTGCYTQKHHRSLRLDAVIAIKWNHYLNTKFQKSYFKILYTTFVGHWKPVNSNLSTGLID